MFSLTAVGALFAILYEHNPSASWPNFLPAIIGLYGTVFVFAVDCHYRQEKEVAYVSDGEAFESRREAIKKMNSFAFWGKLDCLEWLHILAPVVVGGIASATLFSDGVGEWRTEMDLAMTILTAVTAVATLIIAFLTWRVSRRVKDLEEQYAQSRERASAVWHMVDDAMQCGYELQDAIRNGREPRDAKQQIAKTWEWIHRFGNFSYHALGYHAYRVVFMNFWSSDRLAEQVQQGATIPNAIQLVLNNVYDHNFDKVADGKIRREFDVNAWRGWTPKLPIPNGVKEIEPPIPGDDQ